jgi:glycogen synthase
MRILMLSWEYPPHTVGGLGKHVAELLPALLQKQDTSIDLLTPRWEGGSPEEALGTNGRVFRVEPSRGTPEDFMGTVTKTNYALEAKAESLILDSGVYDIIHAHDWLVAYAAVAEKHRYRTPLVSTIHATEKGRVRGDLQTELQRAIHGIEWWLTYESWRVITASRYMSEQVRESFALPPDKLDVIPNGVDTTRFDNLESEDLSEFRSSWARPEEKIVFFVGRLVWEKGIQVLIRAIPMIKAQMPGTKFVMAGTGPVLQDLRNLADSLGVGDSMFFTGFIPDEDRDRLFKVADVAVFPSLYEPFGIVALEAMGAKTPVIVADTGGLSDVVINNETGIKVYPDNPESLAWGILHTLQHPEWTKTRVENAYRAVKDLYNWPEIASETKNVYDRVRREYLQSDWGK